MPKNQMEIPGTEPPKIKPIEEAAEAYRDLRDKRMKVLESEIAAKTKLISVMDRHKDKLGVNSEGEYIYRYDDEVVILSDKVTVKVQRATLPEDEK